ncbi:MAG: FAD-dependent monooxygenase [Pyrinomonadaceae bacterium]
MNRSEKVLIVGAGPTGLTAACEFARRGIIPIVIDKRDGPSTLSRAVGINAKSLSLLEAAGVTDRLIDSGIKVSEGAVHLGFEKMFSIRTDLAPKPYNFLLALPQDKTESVLAERFRELGGEIRYRNEFTGLSGAPEKPVARLRKGGSDLVEESEFDVIFGCDGIGSRVRSALEIPFDGKTLEGEWGVADVEAVAPEFADRASVYILGRNLARIIIPIAKERYRIVGSSENPLENLPVGFAVGKVNRTATFRIQVRQAETYQKGKVFIGGDAAHCHSPVGGRGMNLGMDDACTFVDLITGGMEERYSELRIPVGRRTIRITEFGRRMALSDTFISRFGIRRVMPMLLGSKWIGRAFAGFVLDNP